MKIKAIEILEKDILFFSSELEKYDVNSYDYTLVKTIINKYKDALEELKEIQKNLEVSNPLIESFESISNKVMSFDIKEIGEKIIEAINNIQVKTCGNCKSLNTNIQLLSYPPKYICKNENSSHNYIKDLNFCCDKWESK